MSAKKGARSRAWSQRQANDPYVAQARARGFRSRAAFKLEQLDKKDRLFRAGMTVVDLGAAPGSWSQYATSRVGPKGKVIALDRLEIAPITGIHMILGDFLDPSVKEQVTVSLEGRPLDLVISDMAPNLTGIKNVDQVAMGELVTQAAVFAHSQLREHGVFVAKFFEGVEAKGVLDGLSERFGSFRVRKPKASRSESTEVYVVARDPI